MHPALLRLSAFSSSAACSLRSHVFASWETHSPLAGTLCVILTKSQVSQARNPRLLLLLTSASVVGFFLSFMWMQAGLCPHEDNQGHLRSPPGDYILASLLCPFPEASVKHSEKGREVFSDGSNSVKAAGAASQACGPPRPGIRTCFYRVTLHEEEQIGGHLLTAPCCPRPGRPHTHRSPSGSFMDC